MKNTALLIIVVLSVLALLLLSNCAQPLESNTISSSGTPGIEIKIDTLYLHDTTIVIHDGEVDTIIVVDTAIIPDTILVPDTVIMPDTVIIPDTIIVTDTTVDTVIIVEPGEGPMICGRLSGCHKDIVWLFRNAEGPFHLEFAAQQEKGKPEHTLTIWIGTQSYAWDLKSGLELIVDTNLPANATIRVTTSKPPSYGHAIDVCLTWTAL